MKYHPLTRLFCKRHYYDCFEFDVSEIDKKLRQWLQIKADYIATAFHEDLPNKKEQILDCLNSWLELDKNDTLEDRFCKVLHGAISDEKGEKCFWTMKKPPSMLAKIAKAYYKEHPEDLWE